MNQIVIRNASLADARRILDIYSYYIKNTAITFEYDVPTLEEFQARMAHIMEKYPYLVIEKDDVIQGYAYAREFVGRAACDWSCEMSIYLARDAQKCGLGRKLYEALEEALKEMGMINLYACIAYPEEEDQYLTKNSIEFHKHLGFSFVGEFKKCGYKFQNWYSLIWVEKIIGEHKKEVEPIQYYDK